MPSPIIYGLHGAAANLFGGTMVGNFLTAVYAYRAPRQAIIVNKSLLLTLSLSAFLGSN